GQRNQAAETRRGTVERDELFRLGARRRAQPADGIGEKSELLENAVVRDRAELRWMGQLDARGSVRLAAQRARSGGVGKVGAESIEKRRVVWVIHDALVEAANQMEKTLDIFGIAIEGIARGFVRLAQCESQYSGERGVGDRRRCQKDIAVAALE